MMLLSFAQVLVQRLSSARTLVFALAVGLTVCVVLGKPARALHLPSTFTWNGGSLSSDDWNDAFNWTSFPFAPPTLPAPQHNLKFIFTGTTSTSNIDTDWTVTNIVFEPGVTAMTFTGSRLTLIASHQGFFDADGFYNNDNNMQTFSNSEIAFQGYNSQKTYEILATSGDLDFNANILVDGGVTLDVGGDNDVFFDGGIDQTGNLGSEPMIVNKSGTGELRLGDDSTGIEQLNIFGGKVLLSRTHNPILPIVNSALDVNVDSGATFDLNGNDTDIATITGSGSVDLGSGRLTVGEAAGFFVFSGVISGTGGITKGGGDTMVLTGSNTYTGSTLINSGTLQLLSSGRISDDSDVSISASATFDLNEVSDTVDSIQGAGTIRLGGGTLTVDETVGVRTFSGDILETGTLVKNGGGTLTLSGNNTFDVELYLSGGTLSVSESNNLGDVGTNMVFFGGTLQSTGSFTNPRDVFVGPFNSGTFNVNGGTTLTQSGVIAGDSTTTLTKSGGGTLLLNAINTLSGDININEGIVALGDHNRINDDSDITILVGATFDLDGFSQTIDALNGAGNVTLGNPSNLFAVGNNNGSGTFSGVISGNGAFAKIGTGIQTLSGNNTYTNETLVFEGTLRTSGTGRLSDLTDVEVFSGATFDLNDFGETIDALDGDGNVTLGTGFLLVGANNGSGTFSGVISGSGGFGKIGTGIQTLSGNNTYTGSTTVGAGTLRLSGADRLSDSTDVTVSSGATFDLNGFSDTIDALAGAGNVTLGAGNILTVGANNGSGTFSGNITETGQLFKTGSGTQTLTGTNTYENTFVNQGTLVLSGGGSISQNALITGSSNGSDGTTIVDGGSTTWSLNTNLFVGLAGTGQMNINNGATVTVAGDASVAEFVGADGTLNISSGGSNSTLDVANGIGIGGEVSLAGGTADVTINAGGLLQVGGTTQIWDDGTLTLSGGSVTTTDFFKTSGATFNLDGGTFEVSGGDSVFNSSLIYGGAEPTAPEFRATGGADVAVAFTWQIGAVAGEFGSTVISGVNGVRRSTIRGTGGGAGADLVVGLNGTGTLTVSDGGLADLRDDFILGNGSTGDGTVVVSGVNGAFRSTVEANNSGANSVVQIGRAGAGDLSIASGGLVTTSGDAFVGQLAGSTGALTIGGSGGGFDATLDVADDMGIGGSTGSAGGTADVTINTGGRLQVGDALKLWGAGTVDLLGGTLDAATIDDTEGGTFNFAGGRLQVDTFIGSLTNQGGTLAPGNSPGTTVITGNYDQPLGTLEIEINGLVAGTNFDFVSVTGIATLGGTLDLQFIDGFTPSAGDTFEILTATSVVDTFDTLNLPSLPGDLLWFVNYNATSVELVSTYGADFDEDGDVDDLDLAAWEGGFGSASAIHMTGDANADTAANGFDFLIWQRQFGSGDGMPLAAASTVPEPTSVLLAALGLLTLSTRRMRA